MNSRTTLTADGPEAGHPLLAAHLATIQQIPAGAIGGPMAVVEHVLPAGQPASPPQVHRSGDVWAIVLEGTLGARIGDECIEAGRGECIVKRRGQVHTFWNAGETPVRFVELLIPTR
jgi:mannose-6-phosphate isomerase-like protein (cupin superfamily)